MLMKFNYSAQFQKDLKRLKKKIPSLEGDLENFKRYFGAVELDNNKRYITLWMGDDQVVRIVKTRLMVRSLKGSTMTRLVFAFCVKRHQIDFLELYLKNDKNREDSKRIEAYREQIK